MKRSFATLSALTAALLCLTSIEPASGQQNQQWGTIKGTVVWGGKQLPKPQLIQVPAGAQVLAKNPRFKGGELTDDAYIVNPKNKGIKNVFVYLLVLPGQKIAIHPKLQAVPKAPVFIDATNGTFEPRCTILREGQPLFVSNNGNFVFNLKVVGDLVANAGGNLVLKANAQADFSGLKAQRWPLMLECNIHAWMKSRIGVFDHPYFTLTDSDGKFEIKDAPVGDHKLMIYHEERGYRLGAKGSKGENVTVPAGVAVNLGPLPM